MADVFENMRGKPERELLARLNELVQENFKATFTTEEMKPERGAEIRARRREIARIKTILAGRRALARARAEEGKLEAAIQDSGAPHQGTAKVKAARSRMLGRLKSVKRTIRELAPLKGAEASDKK